jgi:hypothetical protein
VEAGTGGKDRARRHVERQGEVGVVVLVEKARADVERAAGGRLNFNGLRALQ